VCVRTPRHGNKLSTTYGETKNKLILIFTREPTTLTRVLQFCSVPPGKCCESTLNYAMKASSKFLPFMLFVIIFTIISYYITLQLEIALLNNLTHYPRFFIFLIWKLLNVKQWWYGVCCAWAWVHASICVCMRIWCQQCMRIQPAFGLITVHTYTHAKTGPSFACVYTCIVVCDWWQPRSCLSVASAASHCTLKL
jgi:hypothetical protein